MNRLALFLLLSLNSCGYNFGQGSIADSYNTVYIPYVEGDSTGEFTTILIRTMSEKGALTYQSNCADLALNACLFEPSDENIGFSYAPNTKIVVSDQARLKLTAKVTLIDRRLSCIVLGPIEITSWIDYDFEPDLGTVSSNTFSLGQLEMHNIAQDAAFTPLFNLLAEKIVDYVNHSW